MLYNFKNDLKCKGMFITSNTNTCHLRCIQMWSLLAVAFLHLSSAVQWSTPR